MDVRKVQLPLESSKSFNVGDCILVTGKVFAGRDAVLPKVCMMVEAGEVGVLSADFEGNALLHTAVSLAGIGPTSSNKVEIEESFSDMCKVGIKLFLGKGALSEATTRILEEADAMFAVTPPTTALFEKGMISKKIIAFPELGMEALWELELVDCPAIVAISNGESMF